MKYETGSTYKVKEKVRNIGFFRKNEMNMKRFMAYNMITRKY